MRIHIAKILFPILQSKKFIIRLYRNIFQISLSSTYLNIKLNEKHFSFVKYSHNKNYMEVFQV